MDDTSPKSCDDTAQAGTATGELPDISALVVDAAAAGEVHETRDAFTDFLWSALEQGYQIYVCSSTTREGGSDALANEEFTHPRLIWLHGEMPPTQAQVTKHSALTQRTTLWITDDPGLTAWARQAGAHSLSVSRGEASFTSQLYVSGWGQLSGLLNPTERAVSQIAEAVLALRESRPPGPILIGLGGPPESGYQQLAIHLKRVLEAGAIPLVELLDLTSYFAVGEPPAAGEKEFPDRPGDTWLLQEVLAPIAKGRSVYFEKAPSDVPKEFMHHFPLYISQESVVILLGELLFQRAVRDRLHLAILIEVAPAETARRMFEIPEEQSFEEEFVKQYLERDGREYETYLVKNQVVEGADIRLDGNRPLHMMVKATMGRTN